MLQRPRVGWAGMGCLQFYHQNSRKSMRGFHGWFLFPGHFHLGKMAPPCTPKFASYYSRAVELRSPLNQFLASQRRTSICQFGLRAPQKTEAGGFPNSSKWLAFLRAFCDYVMQTDWRGPGVDLGGICGSLSKEPAHQGGYSSRSPHQMEPDLSPSVLQPLLSLATNLHPLPGSLRR